MILSVYVVHRKIALESGISYISIKSHDEKHLSSSPSLCFKQRVPNGFASASDPFATPRCSALSYVHHHTWRRMWRELL